MVIVSPLVQVDAGNAQRFWEASCPPARITPSSWRTWADLAALPASDWHALSALVMALKRTDVTGGKLRVGVGTPAVRRVLAEAGMDRLFAIFDSLADAMPHREPPVEPGLTDCAPA